MTDYKKAVEELKRDQMRQGMFAGVRQAPDTEAKLQALADRVGLPVEAVRRRQPEVELYDRLTSIDYTKAVKDTPKTAAFLSDPKNASVAHDDYENMAVTEKLLTRGLDLIGATGEGVIGRGGAGSVFSGSAALYDVGVRRLENLLDAVLPDAAMEKLRTPIPWWTNPSALLRWQGEGLKAVGDRMGPPKERENLATDVAGGVGQLGFQIGMALLSGGSSTAVSGTTLFTQGADIMEEKTRLDDSPQANKDLAVVTGSGITFLTERYGLDKILNRVPPEIKNRTLRFIADKIAAGGIEAAQEFTEGLLQDVTRVALTNSDAQILEGVDREMTAAALSAALVRTMLGVKGYRQARQTEQFIQALGDQSANSKLRERLPGSYAALVADLTVDGPLQQVMIPADRFAEYFQTAGIDPAQKASEIGATNFVEALAAGSDVVIPMNRFVTDIAPTDDLQGLMQDVRLTPDAMTPREAAEYEKNRAEIDRQVQEEVDRINQAAQAEGEIDQAIQRVVSDVEGQLTQRYDQQTARSMATVMRGVAVLAQRANPEANPLQAAEALWARYGLTIEPMAGMETGQQGGEVFDQSAFHGSPYRFSKFTLDHIGKGEGAQAFGWGLYFAGKRAIAEFYREKLTRKSRTVPSVSGPYTDGNYRTIVGTLKSRLKNLTDSEKKSEDITTIVDDAIAEEISDREDHLIDPDSQFDDWMLINTLKEIRKALASGDLIITPARPGQLYEVDIPSDDVLLQWDKPLSEQPDKVREALYSSDIAGVGLSALGWKGAPDGMHARGMARISGEQMYRDLQEALGSAEEASRALNSLGIPGISYPAESLSGGKGDSRNYVIFDEDAIQILDTFYQKNRGSLQIGENRSMRINLFEQANLSTFLHETGHFYLEVIGDLAEQPETSQQVRDDFAAILTWLGASDRTQITRDMHERWARANEAYLMEGNAPSPELRGVFKRFSAWLKLIYKQLVNLNVELTDEVRGVMDRIYATDAEIERAKQDAGLQSLFIDAEAAGMTEQEFALYRDAVDEQTVEAKDELQRKLMRTERLKREAWWREERARVAERVAADYDARDDVQAFNRMAATDSTERLNRQQLIDLYGEDITKRLPRRNGAAVYEADGQDIDSLAEVMGFDSGAALVQALLDMPNRARHIAAESDAIMMQRHGDLLNSVALADEAMAALHNEQREKVLRMELRALNRQIKGGQTPAPALRQMARGIIGAKPVRDLNPYQYLIAERKAAREAFEAMGEGGNRLDAFRLKQRELLNHYLYLEAAKAKAEADSLVKYLRGFDKQETRQRLAKAGADYLEQIDGLLERYEFKRVTLREIKRRESLGAWLAQQEAEGNAVAVPLELQDEARRVNWQQVPIDELRALRDSVKNIAHLASLKNKLVRKRKAIEFDGVVSELLAAIRSSGLTSTGDLGRTNMKGATVGERGAAMWRRFDAAHMKVEQLVEWMDGGKIDGPWARYLFDLADDAQTQEYDLHAAVTMKLEELAGSMPKAWRHGLLDRTTVRMPGFDQPMTRYDLISIALNMGNAQNIQRLQDGYQWSDADLQRVRDALTEDDMRYVQGTWDTLETLWPHMAALEERASGLPPEKVAAQEIEVGGKTYRGGYFPLVYDPRKSNAGEKQTSETESVQSFMAQGYGRAATNRGATKQRLEKVNAAVLLDYEQVVTSHLAKVIKDISHREAVIGINKILTQPEIKAELIDRLGEADYTEMRKWLQTLVMDRADSLHQASGLGKLIMKARTNTAIVTMGWKISTMMAQFAGLGPSLDLVKPQYFTKALITAARSPRETWQLITAKSGEMRNRSNTIERDVRDALLRMRGEGGALADVRRTAFYLTAMADRMISMPTWLGAYQQALAEGKTEEDAIRAGDRSVRLSQGAGGPKDLAAVQRQNELMKLLTMYYTPFNVLYARLRDTGHQTAVQGIGYLPKAAARFLALVVLPAVMGDLLAGRGPDEEEDEVWWTIRKILLYPIATIPVVRDFSGFLEAAIISASGEGEMRYQPSYKLSPVVGAIEKVSRLPGKAADAVMGEKEWSEVGWDLFETSGYVLGLPTAQPRITGEYLVDLLTGEADPENAVELMQDAVFRRQKE